MVTSSIMGVKNLFKPCHTPMKLKTKQTKNFLPLRVRESGTFGVGNNKISNYSANTTPEDHYDFLRS